MSLDKSIQSGKEHRRPYRGRKAIDPTCRNHGGCPAQETLRTLIDEAIETETTGCRYCIGIESHGIVSVKTVIDEYLRVIQAYDTPYNYCPNCGRKIKED